MHGTAEQFSQLVCDAQEGAHCSSADKLELSSSTERLVLAAVK